MFLNFFNQGDNMPNFMKKTLPALAGLALTAMFSIAHAQHSDKETKEDVQRHRAMAAAHEAAAKCLESGKKEDVCMKDLQASCKGLAVGKYCGMKHAH
jgi:cation transport regulator ChaB